LGRNRHLLEIVRALGAAGRFAGRLDSRQEQRDQNANDGNHNQQFDQGKAARPWAELEKTMHAKSPNKINNEPANWPAMSAVKQAAMPFCRSGGQQLLAGFDYDQFGHQMPSLLCRECVKNPHASGEILP
jgi:hypothetical protein